MSAYQQFLDYASEFGLSLDVAFCRVGIVLAFFGAAIVLVIQLLSRLFHKLKLHFQNRPKTD